MSDSSYPSIIKICLVVIPEREHRVSDYEFANFVEVVAPIFREKFPDIEFIFMSRELNVHTMSIEDLRDSMKHLELTLEMIERENLSSPTKVTEEK